MALFGIQILQSAGLLSHLFPTLVERLTGYLTDRRRKAAALVYIFKREPAARFNKPRQVNNESLRSRFRHKGTDLAAYLGGLFLKGCRQLGERRLIGVRPSFSANNVVCKHIKIAQSADFLAEPAGFLAEFRHFRAFQRWSECSERASQASKSDA